MSEPNFEHGSQEKTVSRKSLSQGNREDAQVAYEQFCQTNQALLWNRHANNLLLAITLLSQTTSEQRAQRRHMVFMCFILKRTMGSRHTVCSEKHWVGEHMKSLLHTDYFSIMTPHPSANECLGPDSPPLCTRHWMASAVLGALVSGTASAGDGKWWALLERSEDLGNGSPGQLST